MRDLSSRGPILTEEGPDKIMETIERLKSIENVLKKNPTRRIKDLMSMLTDDNSLLILGYEYIKSNKGATTAVNNESLDGFSLKLLEETRKALKNGSWKPKPGQIVVISNSGKSGKKRPLGLQAPIAKVVQSAVNLILSAIFVDGGLLSEAGSFGWTQGKSVHLALATIEKSGRGANWALEGDISKCFPTINHQKLIEILGLKIDDRKFLRLIKVLLETVMQEEGVSKCTTVGIPQGSILSPVLANIYLNEMDRFILKQIKQKYEENAKELAKEKPGKEMKKAVKGDRRGPRHKEYTKLGFQIKKRRMKLKTGLKGNVTKRKEIKSELKQLEKLRLKLPSTDIRKRPWRITYVRYADDFILMIAGPRALEVQLKTEISKFLREKLCMTLSIEKSLVTDLSKKGALFLGHIVKVGNNRKSVKVTLSRYGKGGKRVMKRTTSGDVLIYPNWAVVMKRLKERGYRAKDKMIPLAQHKMVVNSVQDIVLHYKQVYEGWVQFYSGARGQGKLGVLWYIMLHSCVKTLAIKLKTSVRKVYNKYYNKFEKTLTISLEENENSKVSLTCRRRKEGERVWNTGVTHVYEMGKVKTMQLKLTRTKLTTDHCCVCGAIEDVCMHHVRHLGKGFRKRVKDWNTVYFKRFNDYLSAVNRKQIPVCNLCHKKIHDGKYDGISLSKIADHETAKR